jgi:nicotinic acid mononucleotide adenylyltransferase
MSNTSSRNQAPRLPWIENVWQAVLDQLPHMTLQTEDPICRASLDSIALYSWQCLASISELIEVGEINPYCRIRLSDLDAPALPVERPLRIGVFPTSADPLHWGHILCGLSSLASMKLDKVIFVIADRDPRKPRLTATEIRHRVARAVIEQFEPLFAYSPIALGTDYDGERNVARLLDLNSCQKIDAFYVAGADHCRRLDACGRPDTIQKLESEVKNMRTRSGADHAMSLLFLERNEPTAGTEEAVETFLDVHVLPPIPLTCSSTAIRNAISNGGLFPPLTALPYSAYEDIQRLGLYRTDTGMSSSIRRGTHEKTSRCKDGPLRKRRPSAK